MRNKTILIIYNKADTYSLSSYLEYRYSHIQWSVAKLILKQYTILKLSMIIPGTIDKYSRNMLPARYWMCLVQYIYNVLWTWIHWILLHNINFGCSDSVVHVFYTNPDQYYWYRYSGPLYIWPVTMIALLYGQNCGIWNS